MGIAQQSAAADTNQLGEDMEVVPSKDQSSEHPVPTSWRPVFFQIVRALSIGDCAAVSEVPGVASLSPETLAQITDYLRDYGEVLTDLPERAWDTSVAQWMDSHWEVLVDLWTEGEGRSDLVLSARVSEASSDFVFEVHMVYVP